MVFLEIRLPLYMLQNEYNHQFYEHQKLVLEVLFFLNQKDRKGFLPEISSIFLRINFSELDKSSIMTTSKLLFRSSTTV
jgi:hypothetical protein